MLGLRFGGVIDSSWEGLNNLVDFQLSSLSAIRLMLGNYNDGLDAWLKFDLYGENVLTN
jgi:hypothetical protein